MRFLIPADFVFAYISDAQIGHGFLPGDIAHHLDPDNNDEYLGDIQDWFPPNTTFVNPEDDLGQAIDLFAMGQLNIPINEGNILDPIKKDDPVIGTNPVAVRYGTTPVETTPVTDTTKEDSTMSENNSESDHRPVITQDEQGTQVHVSVDQLSSDTQDRLTMREVRKLLHELKQKAEDSKDAFTLARFAEAKSQVQYWEERGFRTVALSQWNKKISLDSRYIQRRIRRIEAIQQRQGQKAQRPAPQIYKVTWKQFVAACNNPSVDQKTKRIMSRTTVGRDVIVNKAQHDLIIELAA